MVYQLLSPCVAPRLVYVELDKPSEAYFDKVTRIFRPQVEAEQRGQNLAVQSLRDFLPLIANKRQLRFEPPQRLDLKSVHVKENGAVPIPKLGFVRFVVNL